MNFGYAITWSLCLSFPISVWLYLPFSGCKERCRVGCVSSPSSELRTFLLCLGSSANRMQYCFFKSRVHKHQWQMFLPLLLATKSFWKSSWTSLVAQMVKRLPTMWETWVQSLGWEDLLEKEMATHSSILAWKIPRKEKSGKLQSMGSQRVRHDFTFTFFRFKRSPETHPLLKYSHSQWRTIKNINDQPRRWWTKHSPSAKFSLYFS